MQDLGDPRILPVAIGAQSFYILLVPHEHMIDCLQPGWSFKAVDDPARGVVGLQVFNIDEVGAV